MWQSMKNKNEFDLQKRHSVLNSCEAAKRQRLSPPGPDKDGNQEDSSSILCSLVSKIDQFQDLIKDLSKNCQLLTGAAASARVDGMGQQNTMDSAKLTPDKFKCKNFLVTLLRLTGATQPAGVAQNVHALVQALIDGTVDPEEFTAMVQYELNSSPQP